MVRSVSKRRERKDYSQDYFWTKEWQQGEREIETERRQGKVKRFRFSPTHVVL